MKVINITILIQVAILIFSFIQFMRIKKVKEIKLHCHGKKSFQDIYGMNARYLCFHIIFVYFAVWIKFASQDPKTMFFVMGWYWVIATRIFVIIMSTIIVAISLYMTTEIKHFSPYDGIGMQLRNLDSDEDKKSAYRFYLNEAIIGLLVDITLLIQNFYINAIVGVAVLVIGIFLYYFGMADVLQHDNYNSLDYKERYKKMKWSDKFFITNIISYYKDKKYHDKAVNILHENTSNIKKGFYYIFKI